jgi:hypothetical protein
MYLILKSIKWLNLAIDDGVPTVNERTSHAIARPPARSRIRDFLAAIGGVAVPRRTREEDPGRRLPSHAIWSKKDNRSIDRSLHLCAGVKVIIRSFVTVFF